MTQAVPAVKTLLELVKSAVFTKLVEVSGGALWYELFITTDEKPDPHLGLRFPVSFADTAGGSFESLYEGKGPLQRWVRKELERLALEVAEIAKAKEEWKP